MHQSHQIHTERLIFYNVFVNKIYVHLEINELFYRGDLLRDICNQKVELAKVKRSYNFQVEHIK